MAEPGFINRPMSIALDAVRGVAALVVLLGHAVQHKVYTGPWAFSDVPQHQAVVVFFVLSGLVIANSAFKRPGALADYAVTRIARIMPVAIFAVLFSLLAWLVGRDAPHGVVETAQRFNQPGFASVALPLLFLSESEWGVGPLWNPPYWSLANEVWYYALFGVAFYLRGWQRVAVLALLVPLAGIRVLLLLPVWLLGVALARYAPAPGLTDMRAGLCLVAGSVLLQVAHYLAFATASLLDALFGPLIGNLFIARFAITDTLFGAGVVLVFLGLRTLADQRAALLARYERPIRWLAECSFTIYLIHWPILNLVHGYGIGSSNPLLLLVVMVLIVAFSGQVAKITEHRRSDVRRWLAACLPGLRGKTAVAPGSAVVP